jgi:alpha-tubulin suppressor-like RCC1 family protein
MQTRTSSSLLISALYVSCLVAACSDDSAPPYDTSELPISALLVGTPSGPLVEGRAAVTLNVSLKRSPTSPVRVALSSSDEAAGTVSPATLTFDAASWATAQVVTLTPVDDAVASGDKPWQLRFALTSEDAGFDARPVAPLDLITIDDDVAPRLIAAVVGASETREAGGAATISLQLSRRPSADVFIPLRVSDAAEASLDVQSITFTTQRWDIPQQVVVTGLDDRVKDGDRPYEVVLGASSSADAEFNGLGPVTLALINIDGVCGNGVIDGAEACEPGDAEPCAPGQTGCMVCDDACALVPADGGGFCGDGVVQAGEACDEPERACAYGQMSCMTCDAQCELVPGQLTGFCGDGQLQAAQGEQCDPGAAPSMCQAGMRCGATCQLLPCAAAATISGGARHGCAVLADGSVSCWGDSLATRGRPAPSLIEGLGAVTQAVGGELHACFLLADGTARCMGDNNMAQLGDGTTTTSGLPVAVRGLSDAAQLGAGKSFSCALITDGSVKCWGSGALGQFFQDTSASALTVIGLSGASAIGVGEAHACAVVTGGVVKCWGNALLGDGSAAPALGFSTVSSLSGATALAAGDGHTCALLASGEVMCWGANGAGQLGDGTTTDRLTPVPVSGLTGVVQLAASAHATCARLSSGAVTCWGDNSEGQLGDGTLISRSSPGAAVLGVAGAVELGSGALHSCAVLTSGEARCWGRNVERQLGAGTSTSREATPVRVAF